MVSRRRDIDAAGPTRRSLPLAVPPARLLFDFAYGFSKKSCQKLTENRE